MVNTYVFMNIVVCLQTKYPAYNSRFCLFHSVHMRLQWTIRTLHPYVYVYMYILHVSMYYRSEQRRRGMFLSITRMEEIV